MRRRLLAAAIVWLLSAGAAGAKEHVVGDGQTLGKIAKRYQISIAALCKANGISRRDKIKPGQRLTIPGSDAEAEAVAAAPAPAPNAAEGESKPEPEARKEEPEINLNIHLHFLDSGRLTNKSRVNEHSILMLMVSHTLDYFPIWSLI